MISFIFPLVSLLLGLCTVAFAVQIVKTHRQISRLRKQAGAFITLNRTSRQPSPEERACELLASLDMPSDVETLWATEMELSSSLSQTVQIQPPSIDFSMTNGSFAKMGQTPQKSAVYGRSIKFPQKNILAPCKRELTHA